MYCKHETYGLLLRYDIKSHKNYDKKINLKHLT
jgi:hypothetical protein